MGLEVWGKEVWGKEQIELQQGHQEGKKAARGTKVSEFLAEMVLKSLQKTPISQNTG